MPILLRDLISQVPREVEAKVRQSLRPQTRSVIQEALRTECRLSMRTASESQENKAGASVPVEFPPGYPAVLRNMSFPDEFAYIVLLGNYRTALEQASAGASELVKLRQELERRNGHQWIHVTEGELQATARWAQELLKLLNAHDPLKTVLAVEEDCLGVYQYSVQGRHEDEFAVNKAVIEVYWGVVGLVAKWMGCQVEDLALVVLTHELAHAYTQLGADIEGRRWPAEAFARAESGLKEGLAQYYTERVLRKLESRFPEALNVFTTLLSNQPAIYRTHVDWVKENSPEAIRRAMIEVRRWKEGSLANFNDRLQDAQSGLQPDGLV